MLGIVIFLEVPVSMHMLSELTELLFQCSCSYFDLLYFVFFVSVLADYLF